MKDENYESEKGWILSIQNGASIRNPGRKNHPPRIIGRRAGLYPHPTFLINSHTHTRLYG